MSGFIDIHCHILPGLDDGPAHIEESLEMLDIARRDGITTIVATPHIKQGVFNTKIDDIKKGIAHLKERSGNPEILMGADVSVSGHLLPDIESGVLPLLNGKNYLLLEFPNFSMLPMDFLDELVSHLGEKGIYPLITHPERNAILLKNIDAVKGLVEKGIYCQVTAMSITGEFGKEIQKFTKILFKHGLVHVVASDAHSVEKRPPVLSRAYEKVSRDFNSDLARQVFISNPVDIVYGLKISQ